MTLAIILYAYLVGVSACHDWRDRLIRPSLPGRCAASAAWAAWAWPVVLLLRAAAWAVDTPGRREGRR